MSSIRRGPQSRAPRPTHAASPRSRALRLLASAALFGVLFSAAAGASADARTDYLVRALRTSSMFRVRAQAAISLGAVTSEPQVLEALTQGLRDDHPAVRAASAVALRRHGDPSVLPALRRAARDREAAVRRAAERAVSELERIARTRPRRRRLPDDGDGPEPASRGDARFYVAIGRPGANVRVPREVLDGAREFLERTVRGYDGVVVAPAGERASAARRVLSRRDLVGYYLDSSIVALEERPNGGLRARVSVVLQSYPGRNIRSMLNGAATVMGARGAAAQQQAIQGALRGALRNLPQAMEASAAAAQARAPRRRRR